MVKANLNEILNFFTKNNVKAQLQSETDQVYFIFKIHDRDIPVFIRVLNDGLLLQCLAFLPYSVKPEAFGDIARLLHFLNKEIDFPGFGIDESTKLAFYRSVIPTINKQVDDSLLNTYLNGIQNVCKEFVLNIEPVALGEVTFEEILEKSKKT